jgi:uncharacterized protein involved in exopolysaccharide biosynthesis
MKLTPHEQKILEIVRKHPEIIENRDKRIEIAEKNGLSEKTFRNRIGDLRKYGVLPGYEESIMPLFNTDFDDIDLFRIGQILWKSKIEIIRNVFIVCIFSVILAFLLPKTYKTTSIIMPPISSTDRGMFGSVPGLFALGSLLNPMSGSDANTFIAILNSRTVMQSVINKFNLVEFYNSVNEEKAQESLTDDTNFEIDEEGTIRISTQIKTGWFHYEEDEEFCKKLSMNITNYFVKKLDDINKKLKSEKDTQHRTFIENRYYQNIEELAKAEERLMAFQVKNNTIALPEQTSAVIQVATEIISLLSISQVKLSVLEETLSKDHPEIKYLKYEITGLNKQLKELDYGKKEITMIPGFSKVPDLGLKLGRLMRDVEVKNTLYTFLIQQYEEAKIKEAKDTPTVQVLDYAVLPQLKYKPARFRILIIGFVLSTILSMYYVYFRTRWQLSIKTTY